MQVLGKTFENYIYGNERTVFDALLYLGKPSSVDEIRKLYGGFKKGKIKSALDRLVEKGFAKVNEDQTYEIVK